MKVKTILCALSIFLMNATAMAQKTELKVEETLMPNTYLFSKNGKWALTGRLGQFCILACNNFTFEKGKNERKFSIGKETGKLQKLMLTTYSISLHDYKDGGIIKSFSDGSPIFDYTKLIVENDGTIGIYGSDGKTEKRLMHIKSNADF